MLFLAKSRSGRTTESIRPPLACPHPLARPCSKCSLLCGLLTQLSVLASRRLVSQWQRRVCNPRLSAAACAQARFELLGLLSSLCSLSLSDSAPCSAACVQLGVSHQDACWQLSLDVSFGSRSFDMAVRAMTALHRHGTLQAVLPEQPHNRSVLASGSRGYHCTSGSISRPAAALQGQQACYSDPVRPRYPHAHLDLAQGDKAW